MARSKGTSAKDHSARAPKPASRTRSNAAERKSTAASTPTPSTPRFTVKPEFWDRVFDSVPPWAEEIAGILLIVFGVVSFLSLLNVSSDATISTAWANALRGLFGYCSAIVCAAILALGVMLMLPRVGIVVRFSSRRIFALEIAFLSLLALFHLAEGSAELRQAARLGRGGGQIGWALSTAILNVTGAPVAGAIFATLLVISLALALGINRRQFHAWVQDTSARLHAFGEKRLPRQMPPAAFTTIDTVLGVPIQFGDGPGVIPTLQLPVTAQQQRARAFSLARIRPNPAHLPPSMRPSAVPDDAHRVIEIERRLTETDFDAVGKLLGRGSKGGTLWVERPDGRKKRYFTVDGLLEPRTNPKRDPQLPPLHLLNDVSLTLPDEREINTNVVLIENTLLEFDIDVDVVEVRVGPTVTQYAVQPFRESTAPDGESSVSRTRVSKIASLQNDLALALSAKRLRLETPVPGQSYVGIEVPNKHPSIVALRSIYESKMFAEQMARKKTPLFVPLGRDVTGAPVGLDIAAMPHLLIAGTTGSGKSVCIAALAAALVLNSMPDQVRLIMLDPKMVELSRFNGIPHLLGPVETEPERIIGVLKWCTREMDRRYKLLEEASSRNIEVYNQRLGRRRKDQHLPYIVVFVDEIGDLMLSQPDETERTVTRLAQMARAVGIHLIVATQRPSVDVITGLIKANFPSRIAFSVASGADSRVILDSVGAENLVGRGDMLYLSSDAPAPRRVQGCYVSDDEVRALTGYWRDWAQKQIDAGHLPANPIAPWERGLTRREVLAETDPMLEQAIEIVIAEGEASASLIQRRLNIGYPRAARIMDLLTEIGVIGEAKDGGRTREVLVKPGEDPFKALVDKRMNGPR